MDAYLGIDIGTTNSKCLIATEEGIAAVLSEATPKKIHNGHLFFDLTEISRMVDAFMEKASSMYRVRSVGFSSIGESVVPVASGKALYDALMWDERIPPVSEHEAEIIRRMCPYRITGTRDNGLFSIHKILWMMREHLAEGASAFLPVSSYLAYRKTGMAVWDYSQAARSFMFSISGRTWIDGIHEAFSIPCMSEILPMGSYAGECDGIVYGLGGHDHIVGMFGIRRIFSHLFPDCPLYYSSMGTSEVMATVIQGEFVLNKVLNSENGCIIPSSDSEYIVTRSFRMFGRFLSRIMNILGVSDLSALPDSIRGNAGCLFCCDGDYVMGNSGTGEINMLRMQPDLDRRGVLESAYLYLAAVSEILRKSIADDTAFSGDFIMSAGGGITSNDCFMRLLATAFGSPVFVLDSAEISALGAMLTGLSALGESVRSESMIESIGYRTVSPDPSLCATMKDTEEQYRRLASGLFAKC